MVLDSVMFLLLAQPFYKKVCGAIYTAPMGPDLHGPRFAVHHQAPSRRPQHTGHRAAPQDDITRCCEISPL